MAEDPVAVRQPPLTGQILLQPLLLFHALVKRVEEPGELGLPRRHLLGESVVTAVEDLPDRRVRVRELVPDEILALPVAVFLVESQRSVEVGEELWEPILTPIPQPGRLSISNSMGWRAGNEQEGGFHSSSLGGWKYTNSHLDSLTSFAFRRLSSRCSS